MGMSEKARLVSDADLGLAASKLFQAQGVRIPGSLLIRDPVRDFRDWLENLWPSVFGQGEGKGSDGKGKGSGGNGADVEQAAKDDASTLEIELPAEAGSLGKQAVVGD